MKLRIILLTLVLIVIGIAGYLMLTDKKNRPVDLTAGTEIYTVAQGSSPTDILNDLYEKELIRDFNYAYDYVVSTPINTFYANTYALSKANTTTENIDILANVESNVTDDMFCKLVVPEGALLKDIAANTAECLAMDTQEVIDYWNDQSNVKRYIDTYWFLEDVVLGDDIMYPLEGYLAAATYTVFDYMSLEDVTNQMLETTGRYLDDLGVESNVNDVLTMASIIEREAMHEEDRYLISGVFYNRIDEGMPLQSDITVLYALGEQKEHVLYSDLEVDSPYNTYLYSGLTPGPIASPGKSSIDAAQNPTASDYYYFFADQNTGEAYFAETYDEHLQIADEYRWE